MVGQIVIQRIYFGGNMTEYIIGIIFSYDFRVYCFDILGWFFYSDSCTLRYFFLKLRWIEGLSFEFVRIQIGGICILFILSVYEGLRFIRFTLISHV